MIALPFKPTPKHASSRLLLANLSPPTAEDWLVTVWYKGFDGKDCKQTIRVGSMKLVGNRVAEPLTETQAVARALNSLKKTLVEGQKGYWLNIPKAYDVKAVPRHRKAGAVSAGTFQDWLASQRKA